jgi:hypothetical protein
VLSLDAQNRGVVYAGDYKRVVTRACTTPHDSTRNNTAILTFDFNLYDEILSYYTVLHILQIQMCFYNLLLRQVCSSAH